MKSQLHSRREAQSGQVPTVIDLAALSPGGVDDRQLKLIKADVYKSNGIAQRLNVSETPCVVYIRDGEVVGSVACDRICPENIDALRRT